MNNNSRLYTHAKKFYLINEWTSERWFEITYSRKKKIPFDSYINWRTRIRNYILTPKNPRRLIHQLVYKNSRLRIPEKNPGRFINKLANEDSRLRTHAKNPCWFIHQLANEDTRLHTHAINSSWFIHHLVNGDSRLRTRAKKIPIDSYINRWTRIWDYVLTQKINVD